jgi:hypothetical protein
MKSIKDIGIKKHGFSAAQERRIDNREGMFRPWG